MYKKHSVLCVIPARGGSKGLPGKNVKLLGGKPLISLTVEQAKKSCVIDRVVVSTDDIFIAAAARRFGGETPFLRPARLARDYSGVIDVVLHAVQWLKTNENRDYDIIVMLHATAPLRTPKDIDNCVKLLADKGADSVFSVNESHRNPYFNMVEKNGRGRVSLVKKGGFKTRQSAPHVFDMNASIYVWWRRTLWKRRRIIQPKSLLYVMPKERSVDIDDAVDFLLAEALLARGRIS